MPVLTRAAARAAELPADARRDDLCLRRAVSAKRDAVLARRRSVDAYTDCVVGTSGLQVDHVLEIQLAEVALARSLATTRARVGSMATAHATEVLGDALNELENLNVTSARINQAKRGPFTAALNRLHSDRLRDVTLEQLARAGRARSLVDDGTWSRIETSIVRSWDAAADALGDVGLMPESRRLVDATCDEVADLLGRLGLG